MTEHPVLHRLAQGGIRLGLDRLQDFLSELGDPQKRVPAVLVAGTNGKGSTVRMLEAMLSAAGYRVGTTTSPHLQRLNERIRIAGEEIEDETLDGLLRELDDARRQWAEVQDDEVDGELGLTYFEMITAAALVAFSRADLDIALLEIGMGGRLDATNVMEDVVATAITSIGFDHADILGPDIPSIAAEKAGIIRSGVPVVLGVLPGEATRVIRAVAGEKDAPVLVPEQDFRILGKADSLTYSLGESVISDLVLGLEGDHQIGNAAVAITLAYNLAPRFEVPPEAVARALRTVKNPGRGEWLAPDLFVDCAHNVDGAQQLAQMLSRIPREGPRTLLFGVSQDKDARAIITILAPQVDRVMTTSCSHPRSTEPGKLAEQLVGVSVPVLPAGPVEDALPSALSKEGLLVVAGSVFVVGAVRDIVGAR